MWHKWRKPALIILLVSCVGAFSFFQNCSQNKTYLKSTEAPASLEVPDTEEPLDETPEYIEKAQVSQLTSNRILMANTFLSIFGSAATNLVAVNIVHNEKDFGSGMSIYEGVPTTDCAKTKNVLQPCVSVVTDPQTPSVLGLNIRREAWRMRTCHTATNSKVMVLYALKKIDKKSTLTSVPEINDDNLDKAYQLFFRARPLPDNQLLDALTIVSQKDSDAFKKWQDVLLTLCLSPHWQVL